MAAIKHRRKSSEAELSEIFKNLAEIKQDSDSNNNPQDQLSRSDGLINEHLTSPSIYAKLRSPRRSVSFPSRSPIRLQEGNGISVDDVLLSSVEQDFPTSPRENGHTKAGPEDRLLVLEKKITRQEDEITLLKSALASALRRLGTVEEQVKKSSRGRMMPSIPSSPVSSTHPVRPSRHSLSSVPITEKTDKLTDGNDSQTSLNLVKGLLRTIRDKSPVPRHLNEKVNPTNITASAASTTEASLNGMMSAISPTSSNTHENNHDDTRPSTTVRVDQDTTNELRTSQKTDETSIDQKSTKDEPQVLTSSSLQVKPVSPASSAENNATATLTSPELFSPRERKPSVSSPTSENIPKTAKEKLTTSSDEVAKNNEQQSTNFNSLRVHDTLKPSRSSPTSETNSKTAFSRPATTSARARKLSDSGDVKPKRRITRASSELDLSSRQRSRTSENPMSLTPNTGSVKRKNSTGGTSLRRTASSSSLAGKEESSNKSKDEPTRLYIRGRSLNLYPPSDFIEDRNVGLPPDQRLELEWVYGYRGRDCRDNLFYLPTGELVYNIAAVVILYDTGTGKQRHYLGHNDDVKCVALHPNKLYIASGQVAGHDKEEGRPHVRIWNSMTLETLQVLGIGDFERAISCLAFTIQDDGRHLVVVDEANEHVISYWEWENKRKITENKGSSDPVLMLACHPRDLSIIVTCGKSHIAFWTVLKSGGLSKKMGVYGKFDKPRFVLCVCFLSDGNLLSGDSNGHIFEWPQGTNRIGEAVLGAHEGPIFSLCALDDGQFLSGGGRDRLVVLWNNQYQPLREIELDESAGPVRSIAHGLVQEDGSYVMAFGTTKNSVLHGTLDEGMAFCVTGHTDELWGLAVHPTCRMFVTCGYDKQILMCNGDVHSVIWRKQMEETLQSAAFHPKAFVLAIGTQSGNWMVLDSINGDQLAAFHDGPEQLDAIKYSPDGKYIAVGSHDNFIYLYTVSEDGRTYKRHGKLSGHSSFVTHLDWSKDSQYLQSNSGDYEILYWNAQRCKQVVSAYAMRDIQWETWTCVLGFPACGIWPEGADGTDINACCRSTGAEFLVTGDDFGQVNFFRFPVAKLKSECQNCVGHSSHVTCVRFTCDDTRVISTGGKDCSIMQWKVVNN